MIKVDLSKLHLYGSTKMQAVRNKSKIKLKYLSLFLTCECNEQVIDVNQLSLTLRSVDFPSLDQLVILINTQRLFFWSVCKEFSWKALIIGNCHDCINPRKNEKK